MRRPEQPHDRPLIHRDADGHERTTRDWESLTERLIREAQQAGRFNELPGHGQPLTFPDDSLSGEMALAHHVLHNAGAAPPWIETDKAIRALRDRIEGLIERAGRSPASSRRRLEAELQRLADKHDAEVRSLESLAPTLAQHRRVLVREDLQRRLHRALAGAHDSP